MEQVRFDIVLVFRDLIFRFNSAHSIHHSFKSNTQYDFLKRRISKNIVFKQKTKLIDKTTSKHFQTFICFCFNKYQRTAKKRLKENAWLCMRKSLTEAGRAEKENSS